MTDISTSITRFIDSILLSSAGLVSCTDPLVEFKGRKFSTTYTSIRGAHAQNSGLNIEGTAEDAVELGVQLSNSCSDFASLYIKSLRRMFKFSEGGEKSTILHFIACARSVRFSDNRHLKFKSIAPWYWIEPTGTVYAESTDTPACSEGFGPLCSPNCPGRISMFSSCEVVESSAYGTGVVVDWCSARKHGMIIHSLMHKEEGLVSSGRG